MNNVMFMLKHVQAHYPSLFEERTFQEADGTISKNSAGSKFILDPKHPENAAALEKLQAAIDGICAANNSKKGEDGRGRRLPPDQLCLRDGNLTDKDEFQDRWYISANCPKGTLPFVLDPFNPQERVEKATDQKRPIYSGAYVNTKVQLWWMPQSPGRQARVNCRLIAVQFAEDGPPIGGGIRTTAQAADGFSASVDPTAGGFWADEPAASSAAVADDSEDF